jgi:hypothetical protein
MAQPALPPSLPPALPPALRFSWRQPAPGTDGREEGKAGAPGRPRRRKGEARRVHSELWAFPSSTPGGRSCV